MPGIQEGMKVLIFIAGLLSGGHTGDSGGVSCRSGEG